MAIAGRKPKHSYLKAVTGNPGKRAPDVVDSVEIEVRETPLDPPKKLTKVQQRLWDRYIQPAWWLNEFDTTKAHIWVCLQAEYMRKPNDMPTARIAQLRIMGSELGFDPGSRARLSVEGGKEKDPNGKFFD